MNTRWHNLAPGIIAASSFGTTDVLSKMVLTAGADVLTMALARGVVGLALVFLWLQLDPPSTRFDKRARRIGLGLGVLFAGIVYGVFKAVELVPVPVAILAYFTYPVLTGIAGAVFGIERLGWRGASAAVVAFVGLALMIGAEPKGLVVLGLLSAFGATCCRVAVLLVARLELQGADARLTTWYSLVSSTILFAGVALLTLNWQPPQSFVGWAALLGVSIGTSIATLTIFISTGRIGPFRTALIMNLEPLLATILSAPLLGEIITPLQALGGALMLGALVAFQLRQ